MTSLILSDHQLALIERPIESKAFLEGSAGTGKTTAGVGRLLHLLVAQNWPGGRWTSSGR